MKFIQGRGKWVLRWDKKIQATLWYGREVRGITISKYRPLPRKWAGLLYLVHAKKWLTKGRLYY